MKKSLSLILLLTIISCSKSTDNSIDSNGISNELHLIFGSITPTN